jgi:hypothetical protein
MRTFRQRLGRYRFSSSLLRFEERITPADIGDTIRTALMTPGLLGYGTGNYAAVDKVGDGVYGDRDVDMFRITAAPGYRITAVTSRANDLPLFDSVLRLFDANGTASSQRQL